jgi:hypothetical protein
VTEQFLGIPKEGERLYAEWKARIKESEEGPDDQKPVACVYTDKVGLVGMMQEMAHLMALRDHVSEILSDVQGEMLRHFPKEVAKVVEERASKAVNSIFGQISKSELN